jgi:hypothetical protein
MSLPKTRPPFSVLSHVPDRFGRAGGSQLVRLQQSDAANGRLGDVCESCRCPGVGDRVCRRGENGNHIYRLVPPLTDCGLKPVPLRLDPPNRVQEALRHFAASIAVHRRRPEQTHPHPDVPAIPPGLE